MQINKNDIMALLSEHKALNIVCFDLKNKSSLADNIIIASGNSARQVGALSEYLLQYLKGKGVKNIRIEGLEACEWVLIDSGAFIIHIFSPASREFYDLDELWSAVTPKITYADNDV